MQKEDKYFNLLPKVEFENWRLQKIQIYLYFCSSRKFNQINHSHSWRVKIKKGIVVKRRTSTANFHCWNFLHLDFGFSVVFLTKQKRAFNISG